MCGVPVSRIDEDDEIYRPQKEKLAAIVMSIADAKSRNQRPHPHHDADFADYLLLHFVLAFCIGR